MSKKPENEQSYLEDVERIDKAQASKEWNDLLMKDGSLSQEERRHLYEAYGEIGELDLFILLDRVFRDEGLEFIWERKEEAIASWLGASPEELEKFRFLQGLAPLGWGNPRMERAVEIIREELATAPGPRNDWASYRWHLEGMPWLRPAPLALPVPQEPKAPKDMEKVRGHRTPKDVRKNLVLLAWELAGKPARDKTALACAVLEEAISSGMRKRTIQERSGLSVIARHKGLKAVGRIRALGPGFTFRGYGESKSHHLQERTIRNILTKAK